MSQRRSESTDTVIVPGAFIPHRVILESQKKEDKLRKAFVAVFAFVFCAVGSAGYLSYSTRVGSVIAQVPVVFQLASLYNSVGVASSAPATLADISEYKRVVEALASTERSFVAVDTVEKKVDVYKSGHVVLSAPIQRVPEETSWRFVPAGVYQVSSLSERQYSAVQEAYYSYAIQFSKNYLIHGVPEKVDGQRADRSASGFELSMSDAASLYVFTEPGMPIVVHSANEIVTPLFYVNRGPSLAAGTYSVTDLAEGKVVTYAGDLDESLPIASLTKLMTALVVAESYDIEGEVKVESEAYVDTLVPRLAGVGRTTTYNLLQLLLTESSNEAAEVLASVMGREKFLEKMNQTAKRLGLDDTQFVDPSGLGNGNVSSLSDLGELTQYIYNTQPFLWKLTIQPEAILSERPDDFVSLQNFNPVEGLSDMIGGKIGETTAAGQTSVSLHRMTFAGVERVVVIALLGSQGRAQDVHTIHDYLQTHF